MDFEELALYFENPATDAMGHDHVFGKIRALHDRVLFHWQLKERTFNAADAQLRTIEMTYRDVEDAALESRFFLRKDLVLRVRDPRVIAAVPGADLGKITLQLTRESKADAEKFVRRIAFRKSEYEADEIAERLDAMREASLREVPDLPAGALDKPAIPGEDVKS